MIALIWATAVLLTIAACLLFLVVIVISIHQVDHAKSLTHNPRGIADMVTRRVLGVRAFNSPSRRQCSSK